MRALSPLQMRVHSISSGGESVRARGRGAGVEGANVCGQRLPFGDGESCSGSGVDATEQHCMGKERDTESGNDYFGARYYSSTVGRFMSPDWGAQEEPVPYAKLDKDRKSVA